MSMFGRGNDRTEHRFAEARLSAYLDGELSSRERARVDRHLARCHQCQWELSTLRQTAQWARALPALPVPRRFAVPVPARAVRTAPRGWGLPVLQGATAVVALLFVVALGGQLLLPHLMPAAAPEPGVALLREGPVGVTSEAVAPQAVVEAEQAIAAAEQVLEIPESQPGLETDVPPAALSAFTVTTEVESTQALGAQFQPTATVEAAGLLQAKEAPTVDQERAGLAAAVDTATEEAVAESLAAVPPPATEVPEAGQLAAPVPADRADDGALSTRQAVAGWLLGAEIVFGLAFVVLGAVTAVLTVRRLKRP